MPNRWGKVEAVTDFTFLGSRIIADCDCSNRIKRCLLLGRKALTNLDSILKNRDITLPTTICLVKTMVFPVVMYECESCTIKKAEHWRIHAFELWCWRRLLRLDCKIKPVNPKGNQSWIFIGRTDAEAEIPVLWPPDLKNLLIREYPDAKENWGQEERGQQKLRWLDGISDYGHEVEEASGGGDGQGGLACCTPWDRRVRHDWVAELNWTKVSLLGARLWQPQQTNTEALRDDKRCSLIGGFVHWLSVQEWSTNPGVAHSRPRTSTSFLCTRP